MEEWLIRAVASFGVRAERRAGRIGVWVAEPGTGDEAKIAAIGVRVTRWVSWHGIALNVAPDLAHFGGIVPCGIAEYGVTSLAALGARATFAEVDAALHATWQEVFATDQMGDQPDSTTAMRERGAQTERDARAARLAAALRANLRRRKTQARVRRLTGPSGRNVTEEDCTGGGPR
jgi:hypothetical protein